MIFGFDSWFRFNSDQKDLNNNEIIINNRNNKNKNNTSSAMQNSFSRELFHAKQVTLFNGPLSTVIEYSENLEYSS